MGPPAPKKAPASLRAAKPEEIFARRRPVAIAMLWLFELVAAFVIATPVHAWARAIWARHPDGDAVLFRPGGLALVDWVSLSEPTTLGIVIRISVVLILLFLVVSPIATGAVVASLATRGGKPLHAGMSAFFPLLAIDLFFGLIEGGILGAGYALSSHLDHSMQHAYGDERAFLGRLVFFGLFAVIAAAVGVVADLMRVAVARDVALGNMRGLLKRGLRTALLTARAKIGHALGGWALRAAGSAVLVLVGASLSDRIDVNRVWTLFLLHQLTIAGRAALRTSWLAHALRLVVATAEE